MGLSIMCSILSKFLKSSLNIDLLVANHSQIRSFTVKPYVKGLRRAEFTNELNVIRDSQVIPIYRILDTNGKLENGHTCPFDLHKVVEYYKDMIRLSICDNIFYNIQRQGIYTLYAHVDCEFFKLISVDF